MSEKKEKGFFAKLVSGLTKTRDNIAQGFSSIFGGSKIDDEFYEDLEEILIMSDMGMETTEEVIEKLQEEVKAKKIKDPEDCRQVLIDILTERVKVELAEESFPLVILVVGVNGVGKTTTCGKLASKYREQGKKVILVAGDTYRAAATEQLEEWAKRSNSELIKGREGADPSSVIFDSISAFKARNADVLIIDTAGRLHNKKNLMMELGKMSGIINRELPDCKSETYVVLDGTTGQNAMSQAKQFNDITDLSGLVITKLDGTAKGGIAIAIQSELELPIRYIGIGEGINDLQEFDAEAFVRALFDVNPEDLED